MGNEKEAPPAYQDVDSNSVNMGNQNTRPIPQNIIQAPVAPQVRIFTTFIQRHLYTRLTSSWIFLETYQQSLHQIHHPFLQTPADNHPANAIPLPPISRHIPRFGDLLRYGSRPKKRRRQPPLLRLHPQWLQFSTIRSPSLISVLHLFSSRNSILAFIFLLDRHRSSRFSS